MKEVLTTKRGRKIIYVLSIVLFLVTVMLISNIASTNKTLERIKENAREEVEKTLISTGLATYTKDIEDNVGVDPVSVHNENLPENTTETPQDLGTVVAPKENWNIETVTAISLGNGETVPVPIGFYYVGGDLNTGVIISDNEEDQYDGKIDKTTWEYTTNLKGNQFVWIPCAEEEYKKCEVWNGTTQSHTILAYGGWDKTTYTSELPQIRKYEGFYVARYEAGLAETIPEFTQTQQQTGSNQIYNKEGIPQSRAGQVPWNFIDWTTSQKNAKSMYNTNSVSSGLITGTQWDVMLKRIVEKTDLTEADLTNSANWGNYTNNSIEYKGRMARGWYSNSWYLGVFGGETEGKTSNYSSNDGDLLTTGASKQTEKYHIYDVAGSLWEWTDESSFYKAGNINETNIQYHVRRGGSFLNVYSTFPACYRHGVSHATSTELDIGFRITLYIK